MTFWQYVTPNSLLHRAKAQWIIYAETARSPHDLWNRQAHVHVEIGSFYPLASHDIYIYCPGIGLSIT